MSVTVGDIEAEILVRMGSYLMAVGLDGTTADGANLSLRGSIRWAAGRLGLATADPIDVVDGDLSALDRAQYETFIELAEYKALETAWGNWAMYDQSLGSESQSLSQLRDAIQWRLDWLRKKLGPLIDPAAAPGPSAHGEITAGRCYPGVGRHHHLPWRGGWCPW